MAKNEKDQNKKKGRFFKDKKAELKKVVWPSAKQTSNNTMAVIGFTLAIALIVFVLDVCFDAINKYGVVALQEKITSSYSAKQNTTTDNTTSTETNSTEENQTENATTVEVNTTTNTESQE